MSAEALLKAFNAIYLALAPLKPEQRRRALLAAEHLLDTYQDTPDDEPWVREALNRLESELRDERTKAGGNREEG